MPVHPNLPNIFLAVDKDRQAFYLYGHKSPLQVLSQFECTTGQRPGDKVVEGDLRTPEGVYFVEHRMQRKLDWTLYGNLAYPLNYPNPVDRLKGKTGHGIWVHGRGKKLVPRDTLGCVALDTPDLKGIEENLAYGTPVFIGKNFQVAEAERNNDISKVVGLVGKWAKAWQQRSNDFFTYYDPDKFSRSQEKPFAGFVSHKKNLFKKNPWIRVMTHDVRVAPGPDYMVAYFKQYYRTPTFVSEGVKRLYWQRDETGNYRIVGREWTRTPTTLDGLFLKRATAEAKAILDSWRTAWESADLDAYLAAYAYGAEQGKRLGVAAIRDHKAQLWERSEPEKVTMERLDFSLVPDGLQVTFIQRYSAEGGYSDVGEKTVVMAPRNDGWRIIREDWRAL